MKRLASILLVYIGLCCLTAEVASAQWSAISNRRFSAFDMVTPHHGLAAIHDVGLPILCLYDADTIGGLFTVPGVINSIITVDSDLAYFTVENDGLYKATEHWTNYNKIYDNDSLTLLTVIGPRVLARLNNRVVYSSDSGRTFRTSNGLPTAFLPLQSIWAATAYSPQSMIAVDAWDIYLSRDGGANWITVMTGLGEMNSLYCDHKNGIVYAGGGSIYRSLDSGWHWQKVTSPIFDLKGAIAGTDDCTGTIYVGPDRKTRGDLLRTTTLGKFFQSVGTANLASTRLLQMEVFDRGSTVFYLDSGGILSVTRVGVDSTITDSVNAHVQIGVDTILHNAYCPNAVASTASFTISYDACTGIILDSIKFVKPNPAFGINFKPTTLGDGSITVPFSFRARSEVPDSVRCRLYFHSTATANHERIDFLLRGVPDLGQAGFSLSASTLDFGKVPVDSTRRFSFVVTNSGCDTLVIDQVASSDPASFLLSGSKTPIVLAPGATTFTAVGFQPKQGREYLESVNLHTNLGMRFVVLKGIGVSSPDDTLATVDHPGGQTNYRLYPNPAQDRVVIEGIDNERADLQIYDALGRSIVVRREFISPSSILLDVHDLLPGSYGIVIGSGPTLRFVKQ